MKKTAEEILISEYLEEVKDIPVSGLPLFSANDCRILMSRFAEFVGKSEKCNMKTAEEFFRDKIRELEPNKAVIALRHEIVNAEQAMRWAHEFKELHVAEFSSQDKWVSVEEKPLEKGIRISPIFIISEEKGQKYYAESDWDGERFIHPYYGQEMTGIHENVTHYLLPSPPKTK